MTQKSAPGSTTQQLQLQTPAAHGELIVQYEPLIRSVVRDVLGAREQRHQSLDDYVQDALMHCLELANESKMNKIPDSRRLASWISTISRLRVRSVVTAAPTGSKSPRTHRGRSRCG